MGYCDKRINKQGQTRYTAMYRCEDGKYRSAGTYNTKKEATREWQKAEAKVRDGRGHHLVRGRISFREYVEQHWLPNLNVEVRTRESYTYQVYAHFVEFFGDMRMLDIRASDIKRWVTERKEAGVTAANRRRLKAVLSSIFSSALHDEVIATNPCLFVKLERVPKQALQIVTPDQFDAFYNALPDAMSKLMVETVIETGMRWGELTELRVKDFDFDRNHLHVQRAVVQVNRRFHPDGGRFIIKAPKDHEYRVITIDKVVTEKLDLHVREHDLNENDLFFWYRPQRQRAVGEVPSSRGLGRTEPNAKGHTYPHGTTSAYGAGRCRCEHCRGAVAAYRRQRRSNGKDQPRQTRQWDTDGHIPNRWFRDQVIKPALKEAGLKIDIRMHLLRHAHASWLLNGGADLMVVKERLGHASIVTTEGYLHTIDNADRTALDALSKVRKQHRIESSARESASLYEIPIQREPLSNEQLLAQMAALQAELTKRLGGGAEGVAAA